MFDAELSMLLGLSKVAPYTVGGKTKRIFDLVVSLTTLFFFLPLFACIALLVKLSDPGPVIFRHTRIGQGGRRFVCLKFRSMVDDADKVLEELLKADSAARMEWERTQKLTNDPRITAIGKFLRQSSLDELPQLLNVIRGDMSLVGPRPIISSEMARYSEKLSSYLMARPGITGIWQVSGRNDCEYDRRIEMDAEYVRTWRFSADLVILVRTLGAVIARKGSY